MEKEYAGGIEAKGSDDERSTAILIQMATNNELNKFAIIVSK